MSLNRFSTLQWALGASLAVHAMLLSIRFIDPETFNRVFQDSPLEVILVNARATQAPEKAKAIAQTTLAGGGDAEAGRATSPLPPSPRNEAGEALEVLKPSSLQHLEEQQNLLLAQIRDQLAALNPSDIRQQLEKQELAEREQKRKQLVKLLAEIERRINSENARPKKRYISPATKEGVHAIYYDALRRAIEDKGTENFPTSNGRKLYGELTMIVTVNHNGKVLGTEVVESSGIPVLDRRAAAIARSAGPFGNFPPAMRREMDQIVVVSRFKFTRDETLEAKVSGKP